MNNRVCEMLAEKGERKAVFGTDDQDKGKDSDKIFLESVDRVETFFEVGEGEETRSAVNKFGHALHEDGGVFERYTHDERVRSMVRDVCGIRDAVVAQSMAIIKEPRVGGAVNAHQDSWFVHTDPETCVGVWIALEDADEENGCLYAVPGSHKTAPLLARFRRAADDSLYFDPPRPTPEAMLALGDYVPLPVRRGDVVLIHGRLLHLSYPNRSQRSRHCYTFHCVSKSATFSSDNWIRRRFVDL